MLQDRFFGAWIGERDVAEFDDAAGGPQGSAGDRDRGSWFGIEHFDDAAPRPTARGTITKIIEIIRKAKIACVAYCMKASMSPICNVPASIRWAPTQMTAIDVKFRTSSMTGCMTAVSRLTERLGGVRSRLRRSNLLLRNLRG